MKQGKEAIKEDIFQKYSGFAKVEKSEVGKIYLEQVRNEIAELQELLFSTVSNPKHEHRELIVIITKMSVLHGINKLYEGANTKFENEINSLRA